MTVLFLRQDHGKGIAFLFIYLCLLVELIVWRDKPFHCNDLKQVLRSGRVFDLRICVIQYFERKWVSSKHLPRAKLVFFSCADPFFCQVLLLLINLSQTKLHVYGHPRTADPGKPARRRNGSGFLLLLDSSFTL